jgi:hypothetical protein
MKKFLLIVIIIVVALLAFWFLQKSGYAPSYPPQPPVGTVLPAGETLSPAADDSTSAINQELESVDLGNLEQEFQSIDNELKNL